VRFVVEQLPERESPSRLRVLFVGGTRYTQPLNPTHARKFAELACLADLCVLAFSTTGWLRHFAEHAEFFLLPLWPVAFLRHLELTVAALSMGLTMALTGRIDVIVAQSPYEGLSAALVRLISRLLGRRVALVTEVHGDWEESPLLYRTVPFSGLYRKFLMGLSRWVLRHSDVVRAISSFTEEKVRRIVSEKPVIVFPTYTDIELFLEKPSDLINLEEAMVLFVGALVYLKGVHRLLEAMAEVRRKQPQACLVIIGQGDYQDELEHRAESLGLTEAVEFIPPMSQAALRDYMRRCRLLVLPSLSEGLGRVLIEAMACGRPVVGTRMGGIPDLIQDGVNGYLIPPDEVAPLADRITYLLAHPGEAAEMGARGRAFVTETFSTDEYVAGYRQVFETARRLL
jgi:glycosyltransferase involved in cell wall biosynthesis